MPGGDRTGPIGAGPMTGRGAGYCAGYNMPGIMLPVCQVGQEPVIMVSLMLHIRIIRRQPVRTKK